MLDESDSEDFPKFWTAMTLMVSARNSDVVEDISKMSRLGFIAAMIAVCVNWREREPPRKATSKKFQSNSSNQVEKNPMAIVKMKSPIGPGWEPMTAQNTYIGPGWYPIIDRLVADLLKLGWNGEVLEVKEKFSTLRFYNRIIMARTKHREPVAGADNRDLPERANVKSSATNTQAEPGRRRLGSLAPSPAGSAGSPRALTSGHCHPQDVTYGSLEDSVCSPVRVSAGSSEYQ